MLNYQDKFKTMVKITCWMDAVRWTTIKVNIGDEDFQKLSPNNKILIHWLCYINDYQRDVDELWHKGGIVFTEIVKEIDNVKSGFEYLKKIREKFRSTDKKILTKTNNRKQMLIPFEVIKKNGEGKNTVTNFSPRDWGAMYGVLRTLYILKEKYNGDLVKFFAKQVSKNKTIEENIDNLAKEAYILSYREISKAKSKKRNQHELHEILRNWWKTDLDSQSNLKKLIEIIKCDLSSNEVEHYFKSKYNQWEKKRFENKRLWAALRDYFEPSCTLHSVFLKAVYRINPTNTFFHDNKKKIIRFVEFPGDIWNLRFAKNTIWNFVKSNEQELFLKNFTKRKSGKELKDSPNFSKLIRACYNQVIYQDKKHIEKYYPAQMDISYDFASRMCSKCKFEKLSDFCPFGSGKKIGRLCIGFNAQKIDQYCPLLLMTCGYRAVCKPKQCPILENNKKGIEICGLD